MKRIILLLLFVGCAYSPAGAPNTGAVSCPSSGNKPILSKSTPTSFFVVLSPVTNTGSAVYIGSSNVTSSNGIILLPGQAYSTSPQGNAAVYDLGNTYLACATNTDAIRYVYY
jgi:hypothetical protein